MSSAEWLAPSPLWKRLLSSDKRSEQTVARSDRTALRRPIVLRFATDDFMTVAQDTLAHDPARVADLVARGETWKAPAVGLDTKPTGPFKLFQPAQQRFYLVTASLACRKPGLPDHTVKAAEQERVSWVLRRVSPRESGANPPTPDAWLEDAWIPSGSAGTWRMATPTSLETGEERLPMFSLSFRDGEMSRALRAALVPVARREQYARGATSGETSAPARIRIAVPGSYAARRIERIGIAAPRARKASIGPQLAASLSADTLTSDPRVDAGIDALQEALVDPWADLADWAATTATGEGSSVTTLELTSSLVLIDFADWLRNWLPAVWNVMTGSAADSTLESAAYQLWTALATKGAANVTFRDAVVGVKDIEAELDQLTSDVEHDDGIPSPESFGPPRLDDATWRAALLTRDASGVRPIVRLAQAALAEAVAADDAAPTPPPVVSRPDESITPDAGWYVARCVYERPQCGSMLVSDPSEPFQLASFFDPDAPSRPVNVALPVDTSPAALRKYDKKVAFALSDELRRQMSRITGLGDLMDGNAGDPQAINGGVMCSMSMPIITICAMIVMMLMVNLLNLIFRWLPFFKICFPLPNLKAKGGAA